MRDEEGGGNPREDDRGELTGAFQREQQIALHDLSPPGIGLGPRPEGRMPGSYAGHPPAWEAQFFTGFNWVKMYFELAQLLTMLA